jgi:hypothetical protein
MHFIFEPLDIMYRKYGIPWAHGCAGAVIAKLASLGNTLIKDKILTAANALTDEGIESPTNDQVRDHMGGGSLTHIYPVMHEWRESRKAEGSAALEMPADLKKTIETSMGRVWTAASKLASTTVETVSQEADATVKAAIMERDEALAEVTRLEELVAELQKSLADKELKVSEVQADLEKSRSKGEKLTSDNAALTVRLEDRDEQIKGLNNDLKENRDDARALQAELLKIASKNNG